MRFQFTFKQMDSSPSLMATFEEKFDILTRRYGPNPQRVRVTFSLEGKLKRLHVSMITKDGFDIEAEDLAENAYHLADTVVHKLDEQLRRHKERRIVRNVDFKRLTLTKNRHAQRYSGASQWSNTASDAEFWNQPAIDAIEILGGAVGRRSPLEPLNISQAV